jgi:hypothetical protein
MKEFKGKEDHKFFPQLLVYSETEAKLHLAEK